MQPNPAPPARVHTPSLVTIGKKAAFDAPRGKAVRAGEDVRKRAAYTLAGAVCALGSGAALTSPLVAGIAASAPVALAGVGFAACLVGCACVPRLARLAWVRPGSSVALGVLLAPALGLGAPVAPHAAVALLVVGTMLQGCLSAMATRRWRPSPAVITPVMAAAATLCMLGLDVAFKTPTSLMAGHAVLAGAAACAVGALVVGCVSCAAMLLPRSYLRTFKVDAAVVEGMRLEHIADEPTLLDTPDVLCASLNRLMQLPPGQTGLPIYVLEGGAGAGKTVIAQGIAQALGAQLVRATANQLRLDDVPFAPVDIINCIALVGQADMQAEADKQPVVVVIDEADTLLARSDLPQGEAGLARRVALQMLTTALFIESCCVNRVTLVFVTNHIEPMRWFVSEVGACVVHVDTPTAASRVALGRMALTNAAQMLNGCGRQVRFDAGAHLDRWCDMTAQYDWHGRDIAASIASIKARVDACYLDATRLNPSSLGNLALEAGWQLLDARRPTYRPDTCSRAAVTRAAGADAALAPGPSAHLSQGQLLRNLMQALAHLQLDPAQQYALMQTLDRYNQASYYIWARALVDHLRRA